MEKGSEANLLEAISMLLAALTKHIEEPIEAGCAVIEGIAGNFYDLGKVLIRNIIYEDFTLLPQCLDNRSCETKW